jgi:hypothetical protein
MKVELSELKYIIFPGEAPQAEWHSEYNDTYRVWKNVWSTTFQELDGNGTVFSDDMSRQTFIGSIMRNDRCVGIGMLHELNFHLPSARDDSWFKSWPDSAIKKLISEGLRVLVFSNVTVDPDYRGDLGNGIRLRNLIAGMMTKTFLTTNADVMAGNARCDRGVNHACYLAGATHLQQSRLHGVEVDMLAFYRKKIENVHQFSFAEEALWRRRTVYPKVQELQTKAA